MGLESDLTMFRRRNRWREVITASAWLLIVGGITLTLFRGYLYNALLMHRLSHARSFNAAWEWEYHLASGPFDECAPKLRAAWRRVGSGNQWFDFWMLGPHFEDHKEAHIVNEAILERPGLIRRVVEGANWDCRITVQSLQDQFRTWQRLCRKYPAQTIYFAWLIGKHELIPVINDDNSEYYYSYLLIWLDRNHAYLRWNRDLTCFEIDRQAMETGVPVAPESQVSCFRLIPFHDWVGPPPPRVTERLRIQEDGPRDPFGGAFVIDETMKKSFLSRFFGL